MSWSVKYKYRFLINVIIAYISTIVQIFLDLEIDSEGHVVIKVIQHNQVT